MKKLVLLAILIMAMAVTLIACTNSQEEPDTSTEIDTTVGDVTNDDTDEPKTEETTTDTTEDTTEDTMDETTEDTTEDTMDETTEDTTEEDTTPLPNEVSLPDSYASADLVYECDDGSVLHSFNGKAAEDYSAVCDYYAGKDFRVYSTMDQGENKATTFIGKSVMAHVYWIEYSGELSIVLSNTAADTLPPKTPAVTDGEYECTVAQMKDTQNFIGMGYVIQLKDGSFIVYDGSYDNQLSNLVRYITNAYKGEGKPVIRAWVLTHSHDDHYPTFRAFATTEKWRNKIEVEHVIVSPLNDKHFSLNDSEEFYLSTQFWEDVTQLEGAKAVFAHTGMNFTFCNLDMEILYTPENCYKTETTVGNFNSTCIVSRLYDDNYSALFTGDVSTVGVNFMMEAYGDYLKSDMCQVSHHGVEGEYILPFYDTVKAPILFYPASLALYDMIEARYSPTVHITLEKREYVKEILIHGVGQFVRAWGTTFDADQPISIPNYTPPAIRVEEDTVIPESDRLTVNKRSFTVGEAIMITAIGDGYDWVGIFSNPNTISGAYRWWRLHDNEDEDYPVAPSGVPFDALTQPADRTNGTIPAGTWYITLIDKDNGAVGVGSVKITIVDDTPIEDPLAPSIHVTFDGAAEDACGNATVETHGSAVYEEGFKGQGAVVGTDYFSIPGYDPGHKSFTVTVWAKVSEISGDPALFTTKEWVSGSYKGFALGINGTSNLHANIGDGSHRVDTRPNLPASFLNEWVHYTFVVDRIAGVMRISINFGEFTTVTIPDTLINAPYEGEGAFYIGQDASGDYGHGDMTAVVDDLMIFDHVLTQENLSELAKLYGYESSEPSQPEMPEPERLSVNKAEFKVGEAIMITAIGDNYDWVGIFSTPNTISGAYRWWRLQDNEDEDYLVAPSGEPFDALTYPAERGNGDIPAGTWYITLVDKDGSTRAVASVEITISDPAEPVEPDEEFLNTISTYISFDNDASDAKGKYTVTENGTISYTDGYKGQSGVIGDDGYFSVNAFDPGDTSFSFALWFNASKIDGDPCLVASKDWMSGSYPGVALCLTSTKFWVNAGTGDARLDLKVDSADPLLDTWTHVVVVVDRENNIVKISYNFGAFETLDIPENMLDIPYEGLGVLNIGHDGSGEYPYGTFAGMIDEFMIFDAAMTDGGLRALANLYGIK